MPADVVDDAVDGVAVDLVAAAASATDTVVTVVVGAETYGSVCLKTCGCVRGADGSVPPESCGCVRGARYDLVVVVSFTGCRT